MQTFFIQNKPLIIGSTDKNPSTPLTEPAYAQLPLLREPEQNALPSLLETLKEPGIPGYIILSEHPEQLQAFLVSQFQHWQAAGGVVINPSGEVLLLFRRGKWDLPKGKTEAGESHEQTALREVTEETGLKNIQIVKKLIETWHSYPLSVYSDQSKAVPSKDILKQTFWYEMKFTGTELTVPQIEEDIVDIQWIKPENIQKYLRYSYPNLTLVFRAAGYL